VYTGQKRIDRGEEVLRGQAPQRLVPHPLVAHGADGARHLRGILDPAEHRRYHIAVLERGNQAAALVGIVS